MSEDIDGDKIVLVEDSAWGKDFARILKRLGEGRPVEILGIDEFLENYAAPAAFDHVGVCLVDLELRGGVTKEVCNTEGLDVVLPHIRSLAPWVPVACISRYISGSDEIIAELSCSDFDAFFPKAIIGDATRLHAEFNANRWQAILLDMHLKRIAWQSGRSVVELRHDLESRVVVEADGKTIDALRELHLPADALGRALYLLGLGGTEHTISALEPGFSGIQVSKLRIGGSDGAESIDSTWLLKWGRPVRKLAEEAVAHRLFMKRGIRRTLQIPQFHASPIVWNGVGFLAYAFEKDATSALSSLRRGGAEALGKPISALNNALYRDQRLRATNLRRTLEQWIPLAPEEDVYAALEEDRSVDVSWGLVHGDLHLRNVFIRGEEATLIDFARAGFAPIAVDAAKFVADCLAMGSEDPVAGMHSIDWASIERVGLAPILNAFRPHLTHDDDILVFNAMLRRYFIKYSGYADISEHRRNSFKKKLGNGRE